MSSPVNITILHSSPPENAVCWRSFAASEDGSPIHVCVATICKDFLQYAGCMDHCYEAYSIRRQDILSRACKIAEVCPVILYTGRVANDVEAPCGCYGYDSVCGYHRHSEDEVAECFCCDTLQLKCSYHATLD